MCGLFIDKTTKSSLVHVITMFLQSFACHCGCIRSLFLRINASAKSLQNNRDGPNAKPKVRKSENQNVWLLQLFRKDLYLFILQGSISTTSNKMQTKGALWLRHQFWDSKSERNKFFLRNQLLHFFTMLDLSLQVPGHELPSLAF